MPTHVLALEHLVAGYAVPRQPARRVVGPVDLTLRAGELACLLGPNGAGKSTLLRTLAGMQAPVEGAVRLRGDDVHTLAPRDLARQLSVVLTERVTAGLLTVYELVALGRHPYTDWTGRLRDDDHAVVERALRSVGADTLAHRLVAELSDGERQKCMVARALAQEPSVMILDEITAFLDLPRRVEVMRTLARLAHEHSCAILLSTHDLELALHTADTLWVLHEGRILAGPPEVLVLDGTFEHAFAADGLEFDRHRGAFRSRHRGHGQVTVHGDGLDARWTCSAMERLGFELAPGADRSVTVMVTASGTAWQLGGRFGSAQYTSLNAVLSAIRRGPDIENATPPGVAN